MTSRNLSVLGRMTICSIIVIGLGLFTTASARIPRVGQIRQPAADGVFV